MDTKIRTTNREGCNRQTGFFINPSGIKLDLNYFQKKGGILNAISSASAQYVYKIIERHTYKKDTKWFDKEKVKNLRRGIIHKNAHLDEYFAELIFRATLPPYLKDLEIKEHTLISNENDTFAKISWPNAVVFGIGAKEAGGAKALQIFDEHSSDGSRIKPSCSQLVAEEFLAKKIPKSIQIVLDEVNTSDSYRGAHQYNLKNIISSMHEILFQVGHDELHNTEITKYLTENWKRAIINACSVAMIHAYENGIYTNSELDEKLKLNIERTTKKSLDYFLENSLLSKSEAFDKVKGALLYYFKVGNHNTIDKAIWKDKNGNEINKQIFIIHRICYALEKCWGKEICSFVMMHIWQCIFHQQIMFKEITDEIKNLPKGQLVKTKFGSALLIEIKQPCFQPMQKANDRRKRTFNANCPLWLIEVNVTVPNYFNTATAFKFLINNNYEQKCNNGFGIFLLRDKIINSKIVNVGSTIPYNVWQKISDAIIEIEPDRWFQLKDKDGYYADYVINRNKAHQEHLPSIKVDLEFLRNIIETF